jgi:hypothetical protein
MNRQAEQLVKAAIKTLATNNMWFLSGTAGASMIYVICKPDKLMKANQVGHWVDSLNKRVAEVRKALEADKVELHPQQEPWIDFSSGSICTQINLSHRDWYNVKPALRNAAEQCDLTFINSPNEAK